MSDCCSPTAGTTTHPHKRRCPRHGGECAEVPVRTITHHLRQPWAWPHADQRYYFCDNPACEVVYFGEDGSLILASQLRTVVGIKNAAADSLICYCFGVTWADALRDATAKEFVVAQTRAGLCACETRNPSGRCCLKDFPQKTR